MVISADDSLNENEGPRELSSGVSQFVEGMGMWMEKYGLPRIGGRIAGLLMLDSEPLSLDDISRLLGVSRASVSTNLRLSEGGGLATRVSKPGDRRDYYIGAEDMWANTMIANQRDMVQLADMARKALALLKPNEAVARMRLHELIDFSDFFDLRLTQLLAEWHEYKAKAYSEDRQE